MPFESLSVVNSKLAFVQENQGVWRAATERSGDDPPVWFAEYYGADWQLLSDSLTQFLVTFILHETVFGCKHVQCKRGLSEIIAETKLRPIPLWLDKPYPLGETQIRNLHFYVANNSYLIMGDWCATNVEDPWDRLPAVFDESRADKHGSRFNAYEPIPDHLEIPSFIKESHLKNAIRLHREQIDYHEQRCKLYEQMMVDLDSDGAS